MLTQKAGSGLQPMFSSSAYSSLYTRVITQLTYFLSTAVRNMSWRVKRRVCYNQEECVLSAKSTSQQTLTAMFANHADWGGDTHWATMSSIV
eukprot:SAG22_NODE_160_length_16938_cov_3.491241_2_plen_92_part_00